MNMKTDNETLDEYSVIEGEQGLLHAFEVCAMLNIERNKTNGADQLETLLYHVFHKLRSDILLENERITKFNNCNEFIHRIRRFKRDSTENPIRK